MTLDGKELAEYIKQRHFQQVRSLRHIPSKPALAVVHATQEVVSSKYMNVKRNYGLDIGIEVQIHGVSPAALPETIQQLNRSADVHGIITQLPFPEGVDTAEVIAEIAPEKDVDGLLVHSSFTPPTLMAILWLLGTHGIGLEDKKVAVIGQGQLVGAPMTRLLQETGIEPLVCDGSTDNLAEVMGEAEVIITATGQPKLITAGLARSGQVIIDAGTASEKGSLVGDVDQALYSRDDLKISPVPGGVGPLTVCALFENLLAAFSSQASA